MPRHRTPNTRVFRVDSRTRPQLQPYQAMVARELTNLIFPF